MRTPLYGGLLVNFTDLSTFSPDWSLVLVALVVLGGVTTITGAIAGAVWVLGLAYLIGWPLTGVHIPHGTPRDPWTMHTLVRCAMFAAWLLWAQFTAWVFVEIRSALTGVEVRTRIPGAALTRGAARAIVAVALSASGAGGFTW